MSIHKLLNIISKTVKQDIVHVLHVETDWLYYSALRDGSRGCIAQDFRPFFKDGHLCKLSILVTIREMLRPQDEPRQLQVIDVVWHEGHIYVAGPFKRRLCTYRLLAIFHADTTQPDCYLAAAER